MRGGDIGVSRECTLRVNPHKLPSTVGKSLQRDLPDIKMKLFANLSTDRLPSARLALLLPIAASAMALSGGGTAIATEPTAQAAGISFAASPDRNQLTLSQRWVTHETIYQETGVTYNEAHCPDRKHHHRTPSSIYGPTVLVSSGAVTPYSQGIAKVKAFFASNRTLPGPGLRVVIRNQTIGGNTAPYTDRKYDENRLSEKFFVRPGAEHHPKYLAIGKGENRFAYQIRRGEQVVEAGEFVVNVAINEQNISVTKTLPREVITIPCPEKEHKYDKDDRDADREHPRRRRRHH